MTSMQNQTWASPNRRRGPSQTRLLTFALGLALVAGCAAPFEGMEKEVKPEDLDALKATGAKANGLVVWTSSRDGMPHIFSMKTDGSDVKQLTKGEHTDWRPRFSPDGSKILFQRSRAQDFIRESDASAAGAWDLYTIAPDGSDLEKVIEDATWGSWAGPDEIVFLRGTKVMRAKLGGQSHNESDREPEKETRIFDAARYPFFDGSVLQQPELSHDGHFVALTLAGRHRQVGIWSVKKKQWTELGQGTQIAWTPDGASVYWIDDRGKEQSRIAREPVVAGAPADDRDPEKLLFVDLGGKRSRERFPSLSSDGKWLVFAAAVNDLENDLEDYELFLWEAGTPATSATRLTFHSTNDRWPDVFIGEVGKAPAPTAQEPEDGAKNEGHENGDKVEKATTSEKAEPANENEGGAKATAAEPEKEPAPSAGSQGEPDEGAATAPAKAKGKKKHR